MARIRTVKPEFWTSAQIMECSPMARLLFVGMLNFADDAGRMTYSPKTLKAQIYPSDDISASDVKDMLVELSSNGLILIYSAEDKEVIAITGWHHQKIDKPRPSKLPGPFDDGSATIPRKVATDPILSYPKGSESCADAKASRTKQEYSEEFETKFWVPYPRSPTMAKKEAWREWMKLTPEQRSAACQAIEPYKKYLRSKPNLETVHACRFLSQQRFDGFVNGSAVPAPALDIRGSLV